MTFHRRTQLNVLASLIIVILLLVFALCVKADWVDNVINVTETSQTITFPAAVETVWLKNDGNYAAYVCLWKRDETVAACTTADTNRRLDPGEAKAWTSTVQGQSWKAVSLVCAAGQTTVLRGDSAP